VETNLDFYECCHELDSWSKMKGREQFKTLQCIDFEKLPVEQRSLGGSYNSSLFQFLMITFAPCAGATPSGEKCATLPVIDEWLNRQTM